MFNLKKVKRLENELMVSKQNFIGNDGIILRMNGQINSLIETNDIFRGVIMRTGVFRNKKGQMQKIRNISDVR